MDNRQTIYKLLLVVLTAIPFLLLSPILLHSETFTVNSTADAVDASPGDGVCADGGGDCTLRAAMMETNALTGADVIDVPAGTYTLSIGGIQENASTTGDLDITDNLTVLGAGASNTIIDADEIDRVFHIIGIITVYLEGLTIQNGFVTNGLAGAGGGIFNDGVNLELTNSTVSENTADFGGGILNQNSVVNIISSTIARNTAHRSGAGISNRGSTLEIMRSTINANHVDVNVSEGGGIRNTFGGTVVLTNSTVSDNSAFFAGGISNDGGSLAIINSTISDNTGHNSGGGLGIDRGPVELQNTIVAKNTAPFAPDCGFSGRVTSLGNNLIGDNTGCDITPRPGDIIPELGEIVDPQLGPFTDDGTPGRGHFPLLPDSPAIDVGNDDVCPEIDQLGIPRPVDGDSDGIAVCDIGAYEFVSPHIEVQIDIKPGSYPNSVNPRSKGKIPVAILSSMDFDAPTEVDTESLTFGPTGDEESLAFCSPSSEDVNDDGYDDLVCHFYTRSAEFQCEDSEGILIGKTVDETPLVGWDSVRIVPSACR